MKLAKFPMERRAIVIVMAKWHSPNRCKSRLSQTIGSQKAAKIQEALTSHTIKVTKSLQKNGQAEIHLAISGIGQRACKRLSLNTGIEKTFRQGSGNLGVRMKRQINHSLRTYNPKDFCGVIFIGTDLPTLCETDLSEAIYFFNKKDLIIGPSSDGGYWLLGISNKLLFPLINWPFVGIEWGSNNVYAKTFNEASKRGVKIGVLRKQNDLDHLCDMAPWIKCPSSLS